ncbi:MAG: dihydropteroate synthase [Bacteroidia bacterium]
MGILNVTPDSFSDGGCYNTVSSALKQVEKMVNEGASIIDIGGYSTRPGAEDIAIEAEINRLYPTVEAILYHFPQIILSIDTFRSKVAKTMLDLGAHIINDISGGSLDEQMYETVAAYQAPYILMHIQGTPQTMQHNPHYTCIFDEIWAYFVEKLQKARLVGVRDIVLDVGFGFGKTLKHNYVLFQKMGDFQHFHLPILTGVSRKSMLYKLVDKKPTEVLPLSSALHLKALEAGTRLLRTHDVKEAVDIIKLYETMKSNA